MLGWLYHRMIRRLETRYGYDASYLHEMTDASPRAFRRFVRAQTALRMRGAAPPGAWFGAMLAATLHEDCGPCTQLVADMALEAGVAPDAVHALLAGGPADPDAQLGFDFAAAFCKGHRVAADLRAEVERRWGKETVMALALTAAGARSYPLVKRALGHAAACTRIRLPHGEVVVAQPLEAA